MIYFLRNGKGTPLGRMGFHPPRGQISQWIAVCIKSRNSSHPGTGTAYCMYLGGNGNPLQYPCLENAVDKGAWQAAVRGIARVGHDLATEAPPPGLCWEREGRPGCRGRGFWLLLGSCWFHPLLSGMVRCSEDGFPTEHRADASLVEPNHHQNLFLYLFLPKAA